MLVVEPAEFRLRRVAVVAVDAPLLHVGEEGLQFVEVAGLDRVELVVVALGTAERAAKPGRRHAPHPLGAVLREILLRLRAPLAGHHVEPVVARRHELLGRRIRQQVAGQLLAGELVERLVRVERADHVVAVGKDPLVLVAMEADGVGVAGDVEPPHGHPLAEVG